MISTSASFPGSQQGEKGLRTRTARPTERVVVLQELREALAQKFAQPAPRPCGVFPTGLAALDEQSGGLRCGQLTEFVGSPGSGSLFVAALIRAVEKARCYAALVDGGGVFDADGWEPRVLGRWLWVVAGSGMEAVKCADLLVRDGNLRLVVLDLQTLPARQLRAIPANTWHRFHRLVEGSASAFVVVTPRPMIEGVQTRIAARTQWHLDAMARSRQELVEALELVVFERGQIVRALEAQLKTA